MSTDRLQRAFYYASQFGWKVFPVAQDQKAPPLIKDWPTLATSDAATISAWWRKWPTANIAVATGVRSGFFAADIDLNHGGRESLGALTARFGELPDTVVQLTPHGGLHYFFKCPDEGVRNSIGQIGAGIDVRGDGGYVIVSPSTLKEGAANLIYEWAGSPGEIEIAAAPDWLLKLIATREDRRRETGDEAVSNKAWETPRAKAYLKAAIEKITAELKSAQEHTRNDTLNRSAFALGHFVAGGALSRADAEAMLRDAAVATGLGADEISATIRSGIEAGLKQPRMPPGADDQAEIERLAALSATDYDRQRVDAAARLGIRAATLDAEVAKLRAASTSAAAHNAAHASRQGLTLVDPEPWPETVDGDSLLLDIAGHLMCHVAMETEAAMAVALWVMFAHALDCAQFAPRLVITSPEMRCGKTTLLTAIKYLVPRPLPASNISAAALFRTIEKFSPTLLVDEADTFMASSEEFRGLVNSGHSRDLAFVMRCVGDDHEPRPFSTWAAMAIAGIGKMPATIIDRSIVIALRRRTQADDIKKLSRDAVGSLVVTCRQCARWVRDNRDKLLNLDPQMPAGLDDRAADNWRLLIAIADLAAGDWPTWARAAAGALSGANANDDESTRAQLLADIRDIFAAEKADQLGSEILVTTLAAREDRPWAEFGKGSKPISKIQLARLLRPFGIRPTNLWAEQGVCLKGYRLADFDDAFGRYLAKASR